MNRIKELFSNDSKKLIVFITAGFPKKDSTKDLVLEAIKGGADMIEIGSFIGLAAMTKSDIKINDVSVENLGIIPKTFQRLGIKMKIECDCIDSARHITKNLQMKIIFYRSFECDVNRLRYF